MRFRAKRLNRSWGGRFINKRLTHVLTATLPGPCKTPGVDPPARDRLVSVYDVGVRPSYDRPVYDDIAATSNALFDESEVDGAQFIEAACNGSVGETADCAALS
jgi:hypothetical protein